MRKDQREWAYLEVLLGLRPQRTALGLVQRGRERDVRVCQQQPDGRRVRRDLGCRRAYESRSCRKKDTRAGSLEAAIYRPRDEPGLVSRHGLARRLQRRGRRHATRHPP